MTQYIPPDGKQRKITVNGLPPRTVERFNLLEAELSLEVLLSGITSITCERKGEDGEVVLLAIRLIGPGGDLPSEIIRLIDEAWEVV